MKTLHNMLSFLHFLLFSSCPLSFYCTLTSSLSLSQCRQPSATFSTRLRKTRTLEDQPRCPTRPLLLSKRRITSPHNRTPRCSQVSAGGCWMTHCFTIRVSQTWVKYCIHVYCALAPSLHRESTDSLIYIYIYIYRQVFVLSTSVGLANARPSYPCSSRELCSFAIFGLSHFLEFLDSIMTDENAKYCQKWQKKVA